MKLKRGKYKLLEETRKWVATEGQSKQKKFVYNIGSKAMNLRNSSKFVPSKQIRKVQVTSIAELNDLRRVATNLGGELTSPYACGKASIIREIQSNIKPKQ